MGYLLISISAILFANLWFQWCDSCAEIVSVKRRTFNSHKLMRRVVANSLLALVGIGLLMFDYVPRTPLAVSAYLLFLILSTLWMMGLGIADWYASRKFQVDQEIDQLAREFRRAEIAPEQNHSK